MRRGNSPDYHQISLLKPGTLTRTFPLPGGPHAQCLRASRSEAAGSCSFILPLGSAPPDNSFVLVRASTCLTGDRVVRYARAADRTGFFINVMTVSSLSGLVGNDTGPLWGQPNDPSFR